MTVRGDPWDAGLARPSHSSTLGSKGRRVPSQVLLTLGVLGYHGQSVSLSLSMLAHGSALLVIARLFFWFLAFVVGLGPSVAFYTLMVFLFPQSPQLYHISFPSSPRSLQ